MKSKDYRGIWQLLTEQSKSIIIKDVCKFIKKSSGKCDVNIVRSSFKKGKGLARDYWDAYLRYFNPDIILNQSSWNIKYIHADDAKITIKYKKAPNPVFLLMKKENGSWKVGLAETFFNH
ncbi:hypothetical protein [Hippea sp. KM1]|uniref:hypothetical protein n=1 Tax=Hippea sp. KM1 TaxID=944481 RepID=UPI00046C9E2D|nr:hypothetical protein [Hippea sp. KM1]